ncbi:arginase [Enterovibrio norvegicus]|uniref:arginase n=1 Tax=Enterovibrio norvegicus TaxID=188144 RepID=UPI000C849BBA|nr:arginase [Enterovibrio norvegicus]MCC4796652.1 arginase [Enterovibrio norvegicus]PMI35833.1 arginase [Enterovibrio norvegicus]PMN56803.1 arginase [Enterovibrio norvegicus]TKF13005.1 arginase [Enterovibrio norvegicus]TKF35879.1 arginase [Enterovibrio norvegicus]
MDKQNEAKSVQIIGVPLDLGASRRGTDGGPSAVRIAGLGEQLKKMGYRISQEVDVTVPSMESRPTETGSTMRFRSEILQVCRDLASVTRDALTKGHVPLIVGGDHSIAMGSISGIADYYQQQNQNIGLVWFDAHADMNIPGISPSGNVHGMPLSHLMGYGDKDFTGILSANPKIKPENVALVGVRDIDDKEKELIRESGVHLFSMRDIDEMGMNKVSDEIIKIVTKDTVGFHVSFDVDGCDPEVIPGSGTLVPGGVTYREAHLLLEKCAETNLITSLDLVELNPFLDKGNISAERAVSLILSAFGQSVI